MPGRSRPVTRVALLLTLAATVAACAHPSSQARSAPPDASFTLASKKAFDACVRDGLLVVYNGETIPLQLFAWREPASPNGFDRAILVRAGIPAGAVDTIADMPGSVDHIELRPDAAHAVYPSKSYAVGGPPLNMPHHVYYSCARPSQTD